MAHVIFTPTGKASPSTFMMYDDKALDKLAEISRLTRVQIITKFSDGKPLKVPGGTWSFREGK